MGRRPLAFAAGGAVGLLGGLVGLGGAEFRLPLLIGVFGLAALPAVIVNKAMSLVVVVAAIPARLLAVPAPLIAGHWPVVADLLAGSLIGAWLGASWATRARSRTLHTVLAGLLLVIAAVFAAHHLALLPRIDLPSAWLLPLGAASGLAIGAVAAIMGVAGGELLIPTITVLYGLDVKLAGSLALLVSLPTMLVALARYRRDGSFEVLRSDPGFLALLGAGSVAGTMAGGLMLGAVPTAVIIPIVVLLLVLSAVKVWHHRSVRPEVVGVGA